MDRIFTGTGRRDNGHILGLDGLRALAIVGVTLFHMFPETVRGGYLGVSLFFVLTGYLLAYTGERARARGGIRIGRYFWHRFRRIYPPLLIMMLVTIGVYSLLAPKVIAAVRPEAISVLLGYNNWWQIAQNADYFTRLTNASPFTHLWFMGVELQYYVLWPVLFLVYALLADIFGRRAGLALVGGLAIGSAALMPFLYEPGADVTRLYYGTDTRLYALLFGAFLGLWHASRSTGGVTLGSSSSGVWKYALFVLALGSLLYAGWQLDGQDPLTYQGGMLVMTLDICVLLALVADRSLALGEALERPLLRWIGRRSYSIYLWQYPVIFLFQHEKWTQIEGYAFLEIALILALAVWTDAITDWMLRRELPTISRRMVAVQAVCLALVSLPGVAMMGYGCMGIVESAEVKSADTGALQQSLAANKAAQDEQNAQAAAAAKAQAEQSAQQDAKAGKAVSLHGVACIGDSVLLGSSKALRQEMPDCYIDAEVSRYVSDGLPAAKNLADHNMLGQVVVIALGTNGPIAGQERYEVHTRALIDYLGPDREIYWVTVYCPDLAWQDTNNAYIRKMAAEHPNIHVVDWYSLIAQHPEWLVSDGIHPNTEGTHAYAKCIVDALSGQAGIQ